VAAQRRSDWLQPTTEHIEAKLHGATIGIPPGDQA
jgi:hypothetical protein